WHRNARKLIGFGTPLPLRSGDDRGLGDVVEIAVADVDLAGTRDPEQRRLDVEIVVLRDTIPDVEAGGHRAEVRPLAARLGLRPLLAERAARLAEDLADVDALDGAVAQVDLGGCGKRLLHRVDALAGGIDVEREIALAFELVLLRHVAQKRPDGDARQRVL